MSANTQTERKDYPSLPEPASPLLVHLCPWCDAIHRHEEDLARLDDPEEHFQVVEDVSKNLFLRNAKVNVLVIRVGTLVDDPIHVQIEIVKLWNLEKKKEKQNKCNDCVLKIVKIHSATVLKSHQFVKDEDIH